MKIRIVCNKIVSALTFVAKVEKNHKLLTYISLAFLTSTSYFMKKDLIDTKEELASVRQINTSLVANMVIFNRNYENFPLAVWQKVKRGNKFIVQYVNPQYEKDFGHLFNNDKYSLFGKSNFEIYEDGIATNYYKNDVKVAISGKPLLIDEFSYDSIGRKINLKVLKWRDIRDKKDTLVYGMVKDMYYE